MRRHAVKLNLGPVLFNWPPEEKRDFYFKVADEAPVDAVCVGEVVCSKRSPFFDPYLPEVVERLQSAGKEVVHSTLALIMTAREMDALRALAGETDFFVEANDVSCAALLAGRPHAIGPFVNVYNEGTLSYLVRKGAVRVSLPGELSGRSLAALAKADGGAELEVQVFGRLPLAISARCYHARSHNLHKDGCEYVCAEDADGLALETLDNEPFLALNGTQTMSHSFCNLVRELGELRDMGIACFRLSPHTTDMVAVAEVFRDVLDGREEGEAAAARLAELVAGRVDGAPFSNGYYHGGKGVELVSAALPAPAE